MWEWLAQDAYTHAIGTVLVLDIGIFLSGVMVGYGWGKGRD